VRGLVHNRATVVKKNINTVTASGVTEEKPS
jgi:hypothetical protein